MSRVKLFPNQNVPERFTITKPHVITNIGSIVDTVSDHPPCFNLRQI